MLDHVAIAEDNWDDKSHYLCMRIKDPIYKIKEHFGMVKPFKDGFVMDINDPIAKMYNDILTIGINDD
jgi:hypothetical protein